MRHDALPPRPAATRLALALALAFLASCGGGVDSGGTGTTVGYAAGPITGFGSVIVNGVRYDERSAEIRDDDERLRSSADLRLGMLTEIVASAPVSTAGGVVATASALHYRSQLIGPVERVDAAAGRLTVLGQAVRITASTVIDSALAGGVAALAPGDVVEVYAQYDSAAASHVATRVQRAGDVRSYKLRGPVAALSLSDRTLTVGTLVISYAAVAPADPATTLGAVTPVPDSLSEYQFAGLLRGSATELVDCAVGEPGRPLQVPATAEMVLEGHIPVAAPGFTGHSAHGVPLKEVNGYLHALEGPYGDHTGYYNEQDWFPVFRIDRLTHRRDAVYHSTYTGKPPDEPAVLGVALNEVFVPILQKQFPEIVDFYLPPEGCSYRMAIISIRKAYPGHAKRLMFGLWSFLRQFMYTKFIVVTDDDVDIRSWQDVIWAITTRMDPVRDTTLVDQTPIDYLDFASPISGLGGKMGLDATNKWPGETSREWGRAITMPAEVTQRVQGLFDQLMAR